MAEKQFVKEVADMKSDFPQWYTDVVIKTQLVDYGPVKGTMVIRPYGYAIWENIQKQLDARFKATGHQNAYFPALIPESLLKKEAEHVEGFAPEVAMVTKAGGETLAEPLVFRPTSETIICSMYSKWVNSYRDLPLKLNQWANVVRWEKTTRPFLRTSEFLWQEGHTVHATKEESEKETLDMLYLYRDFAKDVLALPTFVGRKSEKEKFAGADATYGMEAMMLDGKSLQAGTTHHFGQKFSRAYDIQFLDKDGTHKYVWQSSWGVSTRLIGAIIMAHGDQRGLVLPPMVAPIQAIVIPVAAHKEGVTEKSRQVVDNLSAAGIRAEGDFTDQSPGWKFNQWEMKGVPVRLELGPRDIENGVATVVRRDTLEKFTLPLCGIETAIADLLKRIQTEMYDKSLKFRDSHVRVAHNVEELEAALNDGCFAKVVWDKDADCEAELKQKLQATVRVMLEKEEPFQKQCTVCGKTAKEPVVALVARAY
ncbi:MAG: proline--tRNA ligase [Corallococcus sp.]|nr:proline--tRNA ligase [Corallococcus sp.]